MPSIDPNERHLAAQIPANSSWANTPDRAARTAAARAALDERFLAEASDDQQAAKNLRRAYFQRLSLASTKARGRDREQVEAAAELDSLAAALAVVQAAGTSSSIGRTRHRTVRISASVLDALIEANTRPASDAS